MESTGEVSCHFWESNGKVVGQYWESIGNVPANEIERQKESPVKVTGK